MQNGKSAYLASRTRFGDLPLTENMLLTLSCCLMRLPIRKQQLSLSGLERVPSQVTNLLAPAHEFLGLGHFSTHQCI